jgi:hypothetical protein
MLEGVRAPVCSLQLLLPVAQGMHAKPVSIKKVTQYSANWVRSSSFSWLMFERRHPVHACSVTCKHCQCLQAQVLLCKCLRVPSEVQLGYLQQGKSAVPRGGLMTSVTANLGAQPEPHERHQQPGDVARRHRRPRGVRSTAPGAWVNLHTKLVSSAWQTCGRPCAVTRLHGSPIRLQQPLEL